MRRGRGGLWLPSNLLDACGSGTTGCHGWISGRPILAEAAGLDYLPVDGLGWPAWCAPYGWHRGWWHPRDDGSWTECAELGSDHAGPWELAAGIPAQPPYADTALVCDRPDSNREQRLPHASLCTGLGACSA